MDVARSRHAAGPEFGPRVGFLAPKARFRPDVNHLSAATRERIADLGEPGDRHSVGATAPDGGRNCQNGRCLSFRRLSFRSPGAEFTLTQFPDHRARTVFALFEGCPTDLPGHSALVVAGKAIS